MKQLNKKFILAFFLLAAVFFLTQYDIDVSVKDRTVKNAEKIISSEYLKSSVLPKDGIALAVVWGDLGKQMIETGVISQEKIELLYDKRGGLDEEMKKLLYGDNNEEIIITEDSANFILNLLWALGLGNKNPVLELGPMQSPQYGGADKFASTGGWTLAKGETMNHYGKYNFIALTEKQQELVEKVSKNIYRPCCGNSTYFPDCNHGMAMLGLLELMASQGFNEEEMYKTALQVNSYWFPSAYLSIAKYFGMRGVEWKDVDAKDILGSLYSSGRGYAKILTEVEPEKSSGGGGCGV